MTLCSGIKADGVRYGAQAIRTSSWCFNHHPDYEEQRRRRASRGGKRGGRGRPMAELHSIRDRLETLAEDVLGGRVDRGDAAVVGQLYNTLIRAVSVELKVREVTELEERLEELEASLGERQDRSGRRRYGA
jgi:hypothetical protein